LAEENRAEALIRDPVGMNYGAICRSADYSDQETGGSAAWHGISSVLRGERDRFTLEYPCATPQEDKWFRMRVVPLAGRVTSGAVIAHEEITERKRLEASLHAMATTDELTGLANRRQFFTFLRDEHARLKRRTGHCAAVLMMDLDRFKAVNDTYGHEAGDAVLAHVAGLIQHSLREVDKAGRLGGEEFGVLLGEADAEAAESYAERLRQDIAGVPTIYDSHTIPMTISIGIAVLTADDLNVETVLRKADEAMYRAKPEVGGPSLK
jgi:diguanylate cyclase (GGDEF)-like protein